MLLHHIVTIYLFGFSHLTNTLVGGIVLIIHDSGDIFICLCRLLGETKYKMIGVTIFVPTLLIYTYTRIIVFPYIIYVNTIKI